MIEIGIFQILRRLSMLVARPFLSGLRRGDTELVETNTIEKSPRERTTAKRSFKNFRKTDDSAT